MGHFSLLSPGFMMLPYYCVHVIRAIPPLLFPSWLDENHKGDKTDSI